MSASKTLFISHSPRGASRLFTVRFLVLELAEFVEFMVIRAIELVHLAVAERPSARRRRPRLGQHLRVVYRDLNDQVIFRGTSIPLRHLHGVAVEPARWHDV